MTLRYPKARWDGLPGPGPFAVGPARGVLHTTECATYGGARTAYLASRVSPHFTIGTEGCWQHVDVDRAASALVNIIGGVETNRLSAIQIEVVGFADQPNWPDRLVAAVRDLMIWIEAETGVVPWAPPLWGGLDAYGLRTPYRMTDETWLKFNGWCGHQHVPENAHWDPGRIPIDRLLERTPMPGDDPNRPNVNAPCVGAMAAYDDHGNIKGYILVGADYGLFTFGEGVKVIGNVEYVKPDTQAWLPKA